MLIFRGLTHRKPIHGSKYLGKVYRFLRFESWNRVGRLRRAI